MEIKSSKRDSPIVLQCSVHPAAFGWFEGFQGQTLTSPVQDMMTDDSSPARRDGRSKDSSSEVWRDCIVLNHTEITERNYLVFVSILVHAIESRLGDAERIRWSLMETREGLLVLTQMHKSTCATLHLSSWQPHVWRSGWTNFNFAMCNSHYGTLRNRISSCSDPFTAPPVENSEMCEASSGRVQGPRCSSEGLGVQSFGLRSRLMTKGVC